MGRSPNVKKYIPKSVDIGVLLPHIENTFPDFTKEMLDFCVTHTARRNSEVHSGDMPFEGLGTSVWLPRFYQACECLLNILESSLDEFFGTEVAESAREHIQCAKDDAAKAVLPASFECMACGLKISGYSKLMACGLGDVFVSTNHYSPVEFFNINIAKEFENMMGEDNNEPF